MGGTISSLCGACGIFIENQLVQTLQQALKIEEIKREYNFIVDDKIKKFIRQCQENYQNTFLHIQQENNVEFTLIDQIELKCDNQKSQEIRLTHNQPQSHRIIVLKGSKHTLQNVQTDKALIIYSDCVYIGTLIDKKANKDGKMYLFSTSFSMDHNDKNQQRRYSYDLMAIVSGQWKDDELMKGNVTHQRELVSYQWQTIGQQTKITFKKNENLSSSVLGKSLIKQTTIKSYKGILDLKKCDNIMKLFNGRFQIQYLNGDRYIGEVQNGKKHTKEEKAKYYKKDNSEFFEGFYKDDMREGEGKCQIKHKQKHPGLIFVIEGKWTKGELINPFTLKSKNLKHDNNPQQLSQICTVEKDNNSKYIVKKIIDIGALTL